MKNHYCIWKGYSVVCHHTRVLNAPYIFENAEKERTTVNANGQFRKVISTKLLMDTNGIFVQIWSAYELYCKLSHGL